ncbi:M56 family metallopeptidase [Nonomuraea sp. NPDC004354]
MTTAVLAVYAIVAAILLPRVVGRARWADRAPSLAIALWLAATTSVVASVLLAAFALAVPASMVGQSFAAVFDLCVALFGQQPGLTSTTTGIALLVAGALAVRITCCATAVQVRVRTERQHHAAMLRLLGERDRWRGAIVLDYDERLAYCLPGRPGEAVITTAALRALTPGQAEAVLAHERAHLHGRHHLLLAGAEALARSFPRIPLFERTRSEVARLLELLADDVAARRHPRILIATALVQLATGRAPDFALGAGGDTAVTRVRRMLTHQAPLTPRERLGGLLAVALLLTGPAAVALAPGFGDFLTHHCHEILLGC